MYGLSFMLSNRRELKRAVAIGAGLLIAMVLVIVLLCAFLGIHSSIGIVGYYTMARGHFHPIWRDLAWQRIKKGDPIESVLQRYSPSRRVDFPPYTELTYNVIGSFGELAIWARDGRLVTAAADSGFWHYTFFTAPSEEKAIDEARLAYVHQKMLERQAFRIHLAIKGGQDVFFGRLIERRQVSSDREYPEETLRELREIYGQDYLDSMLLTRPELTVEVTKVLYGDLQVGGVLTFPGDECECARPGESEAVFLHVKDSRLIYPRSQSRELYVAVPRGALDWYQSLTADQVKDFEARCLAEWAERGITQ